jgi:hypothetical protein
MTEQREPFRVCNITLEVADDPLGLVTFVNLISVPSLRWPYKSSLSFSSSSSCSSR